jgi:hypothetical protein
MENMTSIHERNFYPILFTSQPNFVLLELHVHKWGPKNSIIIKFMYLFTLFWFTLSMYLFFTIYKFKYRVSTVI